MFSMSEKTGQTTNPDKKIETFEEASRQEAATLRQKISAPEKINYEKESGVWRGADERSSDAETERMAQKLVSEVFKGGQEIEGEIVERNPVVVSRKISQKPEIKKTSAIENIKKKLERGELISQEEAARWREFELMEKVRARETEVKDPEMKKAEEELPPVVEEKVIVPEAAPAVIPPPTEKALPTEKAAAGEPVEEPKEFARIIPAAEARGLQESEVDVSPDEREPKMPPLRPPTVAELRALVQLTPEEKEVLLAREGGKPGEEPPKNEFNKSDEIELARQGAEITLSRITNYEELNAKTKQEGDEKFLQKTRQLWKEFAVHGIIGYDKEKKLTLTNETDLDGKGCLRLMQLAGFDISNLKYIEHGDYAEDRIYFDVGDVHGIVLKDGGKKVFIDHHTDESGKESSATKFTYELLQPLDLLKKEKYLDNLVNFITDVDNKTYFSDEKSFRNSWKTIYGLHRYMDFPKIVELFKMGIKPGEMLSKENLKNFGLEEASKRQEKTINISVKKMQQIEKGGLVVPSRRFGKIVVDIGKKVGAGYDAVQAFGCQTYVIWSPESSSFFITSRERLDKEKFGQGKPARGFMWIKPRTDKEPLKIQLADILNSLTDGKFEPEGKLKEYLEQESQKKIQEVAMIEAKAKEERIKALMEKFGIKTLDDLKRLKELKTSLKKEA